MNDAAAKAANFPGLNRVTQVAYPPGSTWKPVTALAAMQEHLLSPYSSIQCTPDAKYGRDQQVFKNWDPYVNRPMTLPEALATSCDTYFYNVGNRFYEGGAAERSRLQQWARKFGFGAPTGLDIGNEAPSWQTIVPTPAWRKKTFKSDWDKAWNPGDSIQLAIGQKDVTVTPLQMARFYAMIANGGKLVTPYVVSGVEQPGTNRQQPVTLQQFPPDPPRDAGVDPGRAAGRARTDSGRRRTRRTAPRPASSATSRSRSPARPERRRRSSTSPATRSGTSRISRGGAATARPTTPSSSSAP